MVGGSSQIPIVQQKVKEAFGADKVVVHPRPMYAVAEGAAIVAAGLVEKSLTVSRNYCIRLTDDPRFILIKKGEEIPVKKSIIIKTEADGQRLIHFKFFSPDRIRIENELGKGFIDETIGQIWLALDQYYPKGTEITLTAEINTQNEAVQMTAHLRNDESIKVSCSFYRGGQDTAIAKEVETLIEQLNQEGRLTATGVEYVYEMAGGVIQASNSMIGGDGRILEDRKRLAYERLKELRAFTSDDHTLANFFISRFDFALKHCHSLVPNEQQARMKNIIANLEDTMKKDNLSLLQKYVEDAKRVNENLPELVTLILLCRFGIDRAIQINPTEANVMKDKFSKVLDALEQNNIEKVSNLLQQVLPESEKYSDQNPDNNLKIFVGASISLENFSTQEELILFHPITYNTMSNNPYDILGVSPAASDDEIRQAFSVARNTNKLSSKALKQARKRLLDNEERLIADYLLPILPPILRFKRYDLSGLEKPAPELQLIEVFEQNNLDDFHAKVMEDLKNSIINSL